ncbi:50S ribosomal protein L25 [Clostridium vincentii]|uniref:Large ribosomal subunit protein bL25 n=1 Tax=Clostridium vincentii TaxID=52704 RepID=A0A2T0BH79_9CLOT|nr:50S ribosomal protein L25 [Clostridium vincentii]PRR83271.1 50S ribosomal protein L25 [Clostridium vincentii]
MSNLKFNVSERLSNEKAKEIRQNGQVPCVIYGVDLEEAISAKIKKTDLLNLISSNTSSSLIPLSFNGKTKTCVVKELQKDTYGKVMHVDFQAVNKSDVLKLKLPVTFFGHDNLDIKKLILETFSPELELQGVASKMPETLDFNVENLNLDDKILAKDIKLPKGISLTSDPEILLAIVANLSNAPEDSETVEAAEAIVSEEA